MNNRNRFFLLISIISFICVQGCRGVEQGTPSVPGVQSSFIISIEPETEDVGASGPLEEVRDPRIELPRKKNQEIDAAFAKFNKDILQMKEKERYTEFKEVFDKIFMEEVPAAIRRLNQCKALEHDGRNFFEEFFWKYIRNSKPELDNEALVSYLSQKKPTSKEEELFNSLCYIFQDLMVNVSRAFQTLRIGNDKGYPSNSPLYACLSQHGFEKSITYCPTHNVTLRVLPNDHEMPRFPARIEGILVHYTAVSTQSCVNTFRNLAYQVSAHYLVDPDGNVICFSDPALRTHHAGLGSWRGRKDVNAWTLGIEIANFGYVEKGKGYEEQDLSKTITRDGDPRKWFPFTAPQEDAVRKMLQHFQAYYEIDPRNVIGHSDSAVGRKSDPGPLFPSEKFYQDFNIGAYPDTEHDCKLTLPDFKDPRSVPWVQEHLEKYGYACPQSGELDYATKDAIKAFQMHFRPENISGDIDEGTIKALAVLVEKYC